MIRHSILITSLLASLGYACSDSGPSAGELNRNLPPGGEGASAGSSGSASGASGGSGGAGATVSSGGASSGGSAGSTTSQGGSSGGSVGGTGGDAPTAGTGGSAGATPSGPYDPRSGTFNMLVLTRTAAFRHDGAIGSGTTMLQQIAQEQGFQVEFKGSVADPDPEVAQQLSIAEIDASVTAENLANYEIIFHLNTTGDMFTPEQEQIYEDWMTNNNGAFAGVHAATDTENGWAFYSEVTGQYYNGHGAANTSDQIQFEAAAVAFPALVDLPNPWQRNEEWYKFDNYQVWSVKPGFQILGRKAADNQPIMWTREWGNFRAFYTAIGHDTVVFEDPQVKQHLTGGIMWAVRRERCIADQTDTTCP